MNEDPDRTTERSPFAGLPAWARWGLLLALTAVAVLPLEAVHMPAAYMLGAIVAGIALQVGGGGVKVPRLPNLAAEGLLGCLIAKSITPTALATFAANAPLFLAIGFAIIAASAAVGWLLLRTGRLPGTTAIWGLSPGAAQAMMLMAGSFGADARLVAFMQYLRILIVATVAPLTAQIVGVPTAPSVATLGAAAAASFDWAGFAGSLAITGVGIVIARRFSIPAGSMLVPMLIGAVLHGSGTVDIVLPDGLMSVAYVVLGWGVGLAFTLQVLRHAVSTLPQTFTAMVVLIGFCGGLGLILNQVEGIDPLTAYLATSPGGMSSVAVIAATTRVDLAFVISMQTLRFMMVLLLGPHISRFLARHAG